MALFLLHLAGSVALLLWAVRMIRTGAERGYMARLRSGLRAADGSRLRAGLYGAQSALLLQSSTGVALLVTGFVSVGTLQSVTGVAMILGADVGSALTVQVYSLPIGEIIPLLLLVGVTLFLKAWNRTVKQTGRIITGLGLVFVSLSMIRAATAPLRDSPTVEMIMGYLATDPISAFLIGAVLAWAMHSSIAAVLTFATFAAQGILPVPAATALVLGANLGGAVIPVALSLSAEANARLVVLANLALRGGGALLALIAIVLAAPDLSWLGASAARQVVNLHLAFNVAVAVLSLPLIARVAAGLRSVLPLPSTARIPARISALDDEALAHPERALGCATRETLRMGETVHSMLGSIIGLYRDWNDDVAEFIDQCEREVDRTHFETKLYISRLLEGRISQTQSRRALDIAAIVNNLEEAADLISSQMTEIARRMHKEQITFSEEGWRDITEIHDCVMSNAKLALDVLLSGDVELARQLVAEKDHIRALEMKLQARHLSRLSLNPTSIATSNLHQETLRALKQINSAFSFIAYPIAEEAGELLSSRLSSARGGSFGAG
ncbi:Na/Pi cotransporter family protein [Jhaorihella thermophila]